MATEGMSGGGRDIALSQSEQIFLQDWSTGAVVVCVGPQKITIADDLKPVEFNPETRRYNQSVESQAAIKAMPFAERRQYIVLYNPVDEFGPSTDGSSVKSHPDRAQRNNNTPPLDLGSQINIPGPASFPLWPGQHAEVVDGHHLMSHQYLEIMVIDEEQAEANWEKMIIRKATPARSEQEEDGEGGSEEESPDVISNMEAPPSLAVGQRLIIRGTDVSFFIPPTGVIVEKDESDEYVRQAVTLEVQEYCVLVSEDGKKRYEYGPQVVFPEPDEEYMTIHGTAKKARAIDLNEISGIYVKVIEDYKDDNDELVEAGTELFITGKDQSFYAPREEHAIMRYGDRDPVHYAVAIPEGEGRYEMNRLTGEISIIRGPKMHLPDPRKFVFVRRKLPLDEVRMMYPGNEEALRHNRSLAQFAGDEEDMIREDDLRRKGIVDSREGTRMSTFAGTIGADEVQRKEGFTPPRTIELDTKYEGAVKVEVWSDYAVMVVSPTGERRVVIGPETILLEYNEHLQSIALSTGTPKTDDRLHEDVYLRITGNKVSDEISAVTEDLVEARVRVSYRVNFETSDGEDPIRWFNEPNYVQLLTDHMRSMIAGVVRQHGIEKFYQNYTSIIRDTILGTAEDGGERPGRQFSENGMRITEVDILDVEIGDSDVAFALVRAQHESVEEAIKVTMMERKVEQELRKQELARQEAEARDETSGLRAEISAREAERALSQRQAAVEADIQVRELEWAGKRDEQETIDAVAQAELDRKKREDEQELALEEMRLEQEKAMLEANAAAMERVMGSVQPQLVEALFAVSEARVTGDIAEALATTSLLTGENAPEIANRFFNGTRLGGFLDRLGQRLGNIEDSEPRSRQTDEL